MSFFAQAYLAIIIVLGCTALAVHLPSLTIRDPVRFAAYAAMALIASAMKVRLPGVSGTLSVLFLFLLVGIVELTLAETFLIVIGGTIVQSYWYPQRRPKVINVAFSAAGLVIAVVVAHWVFVSPIFPAVVSLPWRLAVAAFAFFVANTFAVAIILALTEARSIMATWRSCYFWSFPYYLAGGCLAALFSHFTRLFGWQVSFLILPVVYITYRSYRLYVDRLEEGRRHATELQAAADRLNSVLESTTDCVFATSADGRVTYANQRSRSRLFGGTDPVGAIVWDAFPHLADPSFTDTIRGSLSDHAERQSEVFFQSLNAWYEVHAYPSAGGVAVYLKEVTEKRELQEQLRHAQKVEAIGQLAGGVAHDFNNLLTIILGFGHAAADLLEEKHPARSSLSEVIAAADRAAALTQRLLAFSRKQLVLPEALNLNAIITGMHGMLRRLIGEDVTLAVELAPHIPHIRADRNQIEQVVLNLVVNARDAMPMGGDLRIGTRVADLLTDTAQAADREPKRAVLEVSDTGTGMDAGTVARIFEPFFTTKEPGRGTGLGLSVVYRIVEESRGKITVDSEPGRGTRFEISFPAISGPEPAPRAVSAPECPGARTCPVRNILLVEDEDSVRQLAMRMLTAAGYSVISRRTGDDALRLSNDELTSVDVLITDVVMPGTSGPDLATRLISRQPNLNVLFLSGYLDHPIAQTALLSRTRHLEKPFTAEQLLSKLNEICAAGK